MNDLHVVIVIASLACGADQSERPVQDDFGSATMFDDRTVNAEHTNPWKASDTNPNLHRGFGIYWRLEMPLDPHAIHIYTDGSCYRNPGGNSGCAAIVQYPEHLERDDEQIVDFGCSESSNQRMELLACIKALKWIRSNSPWPGVSRVQIVTDSRYVKDNIARAPGWRKNDWRNQHNEPRENTDLWRELLSARQKTGMPVHFEWAAGKKSPVLKAIDKAAKNAAKRGGADIDRGYKCLRENYTRYL